MTEEIGLDEVARIMVRATQKAMNEDINVPNFLTTTVTDTETNEKFEFTVKRHQGITPEEKLKELNSQIEEIKEKLILNRKDVMTDSYTLEQIERVVKLIKKEVGE